MCIMFTDRIDYRHRTLHQLILNNAKFMDNACFCNGDKGQSYCWKFLLCFTNQPFDIQIVSCIEFVFILLFSHFTIE